MPYGPIGTNHEVKSAIVLAHQQTSHEATPGSEAVPWRAPFRALPRLPGEPWKNSAGAIWIIPFVAMGASMASRNLVRVSAVLPSLVQEAWDAQ